MKPLSTCRRVIINVRAQLSAQCDAFTFFSSFRLIHQPRQRQLFAKPHTIAMAVALRAELHPTHTAMCSTCSLVLHSTRRSDMQRGFGPVGYGWTITHIPSVRVGCCTQRCTCKPGWHRGIEYLHQVARLWCKEQDIEAAGLCFTHSGTVCCIQQCSQSAPWLMGIRMLGGIWTVAYTTFFAVFL